MQGQDTRFQLVRKSFNNQKKYKFSHIPDQITHYDNANISLGNIQYHYLTKPFEGYKQITLYNQGKPTKMFIETEYDKQQIQKQIKMKYKKADDSKLIDFSYLDYIEQKTQQVVISKDMLVKESTWSKKYEPTKFIQLLSDDKINRVALTWLKSWDSIVFGKNAKAQAPGSKNQAVQHLFTTYSGKKTGNSYYQNTHNQFKPNISAYDKSLNQLDHSKIILFAGPPGSGKTTLARVIGKHCKYAVHQINASDDRSATALITKIQNMCDNDTLRADKKPTMIIIDEVDGALEGQNNGLKAVLNYIQTGQKPKQMTVNEKKHRKQKDNKESNDGNKDKKDNKDNKDTKDTPRMFVKRPVIFICNDPYAKGMKELRNKATVIYFNQAQQQKVARRLRQICEIENLYIENEILNKISVVCNHDIRSSLSLLELICRMKKFESVQPRQFLNKIKLSLKKDSQQSINEFVSEIIKKKVGSRKNESNKLLLINNNGMFKEIQKELYSIQNKQLVLETFVNNMHKNRFFKGTGQTRQVVRLYNYLRFTQFLMSKDFQYHGQLMGKIGLPYFYYASSFGADQLDRIEFPRNFIDNISRIKNNKNTIDIMFSKMNDSMLPFKKKRTFPCGQLWTIYLSIQPISMQQPQIISCLSRMITYGIEFSGATVQKQKKYQNNNTYNNNYRQQSLIYKPDFELLFTYHQERPKEMILSNSSKILMEQSYDFVKTRMQILSHSQFQGQNMNFEGQLNKQNVINKAVDAQNLLKRLTINTRKRKRVPGQDKKIKYKFEEGSGTQIKSVLKLKYFL